MDMTSAISSSVPVPPGNAKLDHLRLALGHILRDDEFGQTVVLQLLFHKEPRFHPSHLPAGG